MGNDEHIWFHFFGATTARCNFKHEVSVSTTWGNLHRDLTLLCPFYLRSYTPVPLVSLTHHIISLIPIISVFCEGPAHNIWYKIV